LVNLLFFPYRSSHLALSPSMTLRDLIKSGPHAEHKITRNYYVCANKWMSLTSV
jgi:hypothetical protein